jgi:hypothetical protein
MAVAIVALVMSMTGGAIAAVNFAKNAGAVDGKSAVKASKAGKKGAAGKLLATMRRGDNRGQFPLAAVANAASQDSVEDLADQVARGKSNAQSIPVPDNQTTAAETLIDLELGDLQVSCTDQQANAGIENAATRIGVTNRSGGPVGLSRSLGNGAPTITTLENGIVHTFTVGQQNTFEIHLVGLGNRTVLVEGTAQQSGQGTADSSCVVSATAILVD